MKTKIISRLIQIFALYLFVTAIWNLLGKIEMIYSAEKINGKVVSSYTEFDYTNQTSNKRYGTSHYILRPKIQYTVNGETHEINGQIYGEMESDYKLGQLVQLLYLTNNPSYAMIDSPLELWTYPAKRISLAIVLFLIGYYFSTLLHKIKEKLFKLIQNFNSSF